MIVIGNMMDINASRLYYGDDEYSEVYVGDNKIWEKDADQVVIRYNINPEYGLPNVRTTADVDWNGKYISNSIVSGTTAELVVKGNNITIPERTFSFSDYRGSMGDVVITGGVRKIDYEAFYWVRMDSITLPNYEVEIDTGVFPDTLKSVYIPKIGYMRDYMFSGCHSLTSVTIGDCSIFWDRCFEDCTSLPTFTIPSSVHLIGDHCFYGCTSLNSIICLTTTPPRLLDEDVFTNTNNCPIYVPAASVNTYKTAEYWSAYADRIQAIQ